MNIDKSNTPDNIFDIVFAVACPHCTQNTTATAVSIPQWIQLNRFLLEKVGIVYKCDYCREPLFMTFRVSNPIKGQNPYQLVEGTRNEIQSGRVPFEYDYLEGDVKSDFEEAADCYSHGNYNAFAAMCRRTIQSACESLGAKGKAQVQKQINELKTIADIDEETSAALDEIIVAGHDGAHPHLPRLNKARATIVLGLMKDVLYQLFVRRAKIIESRGLRSDAIKKNGDPDEEQAGSLP